MPKVRLRHDGLAESSSAWTHPACAALLAAVSAYGVVVSHCRAFYPEARAGRGATTANMAQLLGCALMPMGTGLLAGLWPETGRGYAPVAYQWIFASIALSLAAGLSIYLSARDKSPVEATVEGPEPAVRR